MGPVHAAAVALLRQRPEILAELISGCSELRFTGPPRPLPPEVWALIRPKAESAVAEPVDDGELLEDELDALDDLDEFELDLAEAQRGPPTPEDEAAKPPRGKVTIREYRADLVLRVATTNKRHPELTIGAEVQTVAVFGKIGRWQEYGTLYRLHLGPHFCLVFIATSRDLAEWFRDFVLPDLITERVFLFEPGNTPDWRERDPAEEPARVLLAALLHGNEDPGSVLVERALEAIGHLQEADRELYFEALLSAVGEEKIMKALEQTSEHDRPPGASRYYSWDDYVPNEVELNSFLHVRGIRRGLAQGIEQGRKESLFDILEGRGLPADAATRERIEQCHDTEQLARWLRRALKITALEQLFEGDA